MVGWVSAYSLCAWRHMIVHGYAGPVYPCVLHGTVGGIESFALCCMYSYCALYRVGAKAVWCVVWMEKAGPRFSKKASVR